MRSQRARLVADHSEQIGTDGELEPAIVERLVDDIPRLGRARALLKPSGGYRGCPTSRRERRLVLSADDLPSAMSHPSTASRLAASTPSTAALVQHRRRKRARTALTSPGVEPSFRGTR